MHFFRGLLLALFALLMAGTGTGSAQTTSAHTYHFVITSLPANTPHDAALYLVGSFNRWQPADARFRFRRQADGSWEVAVPSSQTRLEYKVTRGSWASTEGSGSGEVRENRVATAAEARSGPIEIRIRSWEDLSGTFQFYSLYDLLLLFSCFQGLLLLVAIPSIQHYNRAANRWLLLLLGISALLTLVKVVSGYREVANALPKLMLVPDFIWFLYGPLFYFYIRRLLFAEQIPGRRWALHFLPAGLQLLAYLPYFLLDGYDFQIKLVSHDPVLRGVLLGAGLAALLSNAAYWLASRRSIEAYTRQYQASVSFEQNLSYLKAVLGIQAVCLGLWAFLFGVVLASRFVAFDVYTIADRNVDIIWLAFSTIPYFLGYVAIHQPEIFKLRLEPAAPALATVPELEPVPAKPEPGSMEPAPSPVPYAVPQEPAPRAAARPAPLPDLDAQVQAVAAYMAQHRPYTNPSLTIHELAAGLQLPPHVLSRVINEGFGKNFFDFVNSYRVEALKQRMDDPRARQFTLLSLAFEVGFNSKTAFNRAFKKQTDQTPREYFSGAVQELE
ncbi:hypothetical protein GCM10023185_17940 [Hymenobacter saemangeumensis]|uniref:HTH araC/xylS-type domain-containing protein n=1 Tax=Hymenobacter saemangeumensis TaxID=1084522 RepID=A0ABP8IBR8_9BACT